MLLSHRGHSDVEGGRLSPGAGGTPSDGKEKPPRGYGSSEAAARWRRIMLLVIASTYLSTAGGGGGGGGRRGDRCLYCFLVALSFISYPPVVLAFLLAVTLHNFPEGLAVGVGFGTARRRQERDAAAAAAATATTAEATSSGGGGSGDEGNYFNGARSLAFGIALQNFPGARLSYASSAPLLLFTHCQTTDLPHSAILRLRTTLESLSQLAPFAAPAWSAEGLAVSMPLRREGMPVGRAFLLGQASGLVEPIGGLLGAYAVALME